MFEDIIVPKTFQLITYLAKPAKTPAYCSASTSTTTEVIERSENATN
jgi:hypothetical protein